MPETVTPLCWTDGEHEAVAEIEGGRLYLATFHGTAQIGYQLDRPDGLSAAEIQTMRRRRSDDRRFYELGAMAPGRSDNGGYARNADLAKRLLDDARPRETGLHPDRVLAEAGYRVTTTDSYGGVSWQRRSHGRTEEIVVSPDRVYALVRPRGMGRPESVLDLSLRRRIGDRGERPFTIHQIWPAFMDDLGAFAAMAVQAVDLTP
jgi:hypothetical protein